MSEFKGTPGPWKVNTIGKHWNNQSLAHIEVTFGMDGECVCDTVYEMADANLIAAAPELLEALQLVMSEKSGGDKSCGHNGFTCTCPYDKAKAAIAKALGQ